MIGNVTEFVRDGGDLRKGGLGTYADGSTQFLGGGRRGTGEALLGSMEAVHLGGSWMTPDLRAHWRKEVDREAHPREVGIRPSIDL